MQFSKRYITQLTGILLLVIMAHTYVCSAMCALGTFSCCGETTSENSCCVSKKQGPGNSHSDNCQKEHIAFFSTIGKFHSKDIPVLPKLFGQALIEFSTSLNLCQLLVCDSPELPYCSFKPPPSHPGIRILIQSFQI